MPRDRALALLWPELDSERARNNLKQLVFSLRRALSPDVFAATGPSLRLDPNVITVDVWAYEKAIAEGALESAVARYGGPFLDGWSYEEWFGIVSQGSGKGSPFARELRPAYYRIKELWNGK